MPNPSDFTYTPPDAKTAYDVYSDPSAWPSGEAYPGRTAANVDARDPRAASRALDQEMQRVEDAYGNLAGRPIPMKPDYDASGRPRKLP